MAFINQMKIKRNTRQKYTYFLGLGQNEVRPMPTDRVPYDAHGLTAEQCFHQLESSGKCHYCREPEALERYIEGKKIHGLTIEMVSEDLFARIIFNEEVLASYEPWVAQEIFSAARKVAIKQIGFVPKFLESGHDFTNPTEEMLTQITKA